MVSAVGFGFSVHRASIPPQAIIECDGVSYSIKDHKVYLHKSVCTAYITLRSLGIYIELGSWPIGKSGSVEGVEPS